MAMSAALRCVVAAVLVVAASCELSLRFITPRDGMQVVVRPPNFAIDEIQVIVEARGLEHVPGGHVFVHQDGELIGSGPNGDTVNRTLLKSFTLSEGRHEFEAYVVSAEGGIMGGNFFRSVVEVVRDASSADYLAGLEYVRHSAANFVSTDAASYDSNRFEMFAMLTDGWRKAETVCETGFNVGSSARVFLQSPKVKRVLSFDLLERPAHKYAAETMMKEHPGRLEVIGGDSRITIPKFVAENPDFVCDVVLVDGGHEGDVPLRDLENLQASASPRPPRLCAVRWRRCRSWTRCAMRAHLTPCVCDAAI